MKWYVNLLRAAAVMAALLLPAGLWAQSDLVQASRTQQQKEEQKKDAQKPHVWTNDDLPKATAATVSVPSIAPPPPPPSVAGESAAPAQGQPPAGQPAPGAKPAADLKAAEEKVKNAQRDVDETKKVIQYLLDRIPSESGTRLAEDQGMVQRSQERLAGYEDSLKQAQQELSAAQAAQPQGQGPAGAPAGQQPAPPPPPQL